MKIAIEGKLYELIPTGEDYIFIESCIDTCILPSNTDQWNIPKEVLEDQRVWMEEIYKCFK